MINTAAQESTGPQPVTFDGSGAQIRKELGVAGKV